MIIVTGGAGFIGSNIIAGLNAQGMNDIIVVDDLSDGYKFNNLVDLSISDYLDLDDFLQKITKGGSFSSKIEAVFHEGACSSTTEWDGKYMMENNYTYSKKLFHYCLDRKIPFYYASSAAVYGGETSFEVNVKNEKPLNVYGYSKFQFDQYVRRYLPQANSAVVGLRYFNVYGPRESHKGTMASMAFHLNNQVKEKGEAKLFAGTEGYGDGEQLRDFIYIDDVVAVNLWLMKQPNIRGIYNVGTGRSQSFNDVAQSVINWHEKGYIKYIPFPDHLKGVYQNFTQADISGLRELGYDAPFKCVEEGVSLYLNILNAA